MVKGETLSPTWKRTCEISHRPVFEQTQPTVYPVVTWLMTVSPLISTIAKLSAENPRIWNLEMFVSTLGRMEWLP